MIESFYLSDGIPIALGLISLLIIAPSAFRNLSTASTSSRWLSRRRESSNAWVSSLIVLILILLVGLRPVDPKFQDMTRYAQEYIAATYGLRLFEIKDPAFSAFGQLLVPLKSTTIFFIACSALTIGLYAWASKRMFGVRWLLSMPAIITSFTFYSGVVNILRAGIAGGMILNALSQRRASQMFFWLILASAFHLSFFIVIVAAIMSLAITDSRKWIAIWLAAFFASFILGDVAMQWMSHIDFGQRSGYFSDQAILRLGKGVRWDFIGYSLTGLFASIYWVWVRNYREENYLRVVHVFLATNAFWLVINQVPFSDRFAYPSWILIPWLIVTPVIVSERQGAAVLAVFLLSVFNTIVFWSIA